MMNRVGGPATNWGPASSAAPETKKDWKLQLWLAIFSSPKSVKCTHLLFLHIDPGNLFWHSGAGDVKAVECTRSKSTGVASW